MNIWKNGRLKLLKLNLKSSKDPKVETFEIRNFKRWSKQINKPKVDPPRRSSNPEVDLPKRSSIKPKGQLSKKIKGAKGQSFKKIIKPKDQSSKEINKPNGQNFTFLRGSIKGSFIRDCTHCIIRDCTHCIILKLVQIRSSNSTSYCFQV